MIFDLVVYHKKVLRNYLNHATETAVANRTNAAHDGKASRNRRIYKGFADFAWHGKKPYKTIQNRCSQNLECKTTSSVLIIIADPEFGENQRTMKRPCLTER